MPHSVSPKSPRGDDEELPDAPSVGEKEVSGVKLEDMFDDEDDDFPASSAQDVKMESSPAPAPAR